MTDCFWCGFVGLCTNLEHLRCGQRSGPCTRRDGAQQRPAAGGPHGGLPGWRGGSASNPCAGAMQGVANGDGVRLKGNGVPRRYRPVAQTGKKRQQAARGRRQAKPVPQGALSRRASGLVRAQAGWFHAGSVACAILVARAVGMHGGGWVTPCPMRRCLCWPRTNAAQGRQALRPIRVACRAPPWPDGSVAALQCRPAAQISSNGWLLHCTAWAVRL